VADGRGFLALHGGAATFWNSAAYLQLLGSRFIRHDPYKQFTVNITVRSHPITAGLEDFEVDDELYVLGGEVDDFPAFAGAIAAGRPARELRELGEGPLRPELQVLAEAEGKPMLYIKSHGRGRVHYNALGHDTKALQHPSYRRLLRQALAWCAGPAQHLDGTLGEARA